MNTSAQCVFASGRAEFNLVDQPWVPIRMMTGGSDIWSLRQVFTRADEIADLTLPRPTDRHPVLGFLCACAFAAGVAPATVDEWERNALNGLDLRQVVAWLDANHDRFDLFHPERPFFQHPDLAAAAAEHGTSPAHLYTHAVTDGPVFSNRLHLHSGPVTAAQAAVALIARQGYSMGGVQKFDAEAAAATGFPGNGSAAAPWRNGALTVMAAGSTLAETLALNVVPISLVGTAGTINLTWHDKPHRALTSRTSRAPDGPADLLSWLPRAIGLHPVPGPDGQILVSHVLVGLGDRIDHSAVTPSSAPWLAWRSQAGSPRPVEYRTGRAAWRNYHAWFAYAALDRTNAGILQLLDFRDEVTFDVAGVEFKQAVVLGWGAERLSLTPQALAGQSVSTLTDAIDTASQAENALRDAVKTVRLRLSEGAAVFRESKSWFQPATQFWPRLDQPHQQLLHHVMHGASLTDAVHAWATAVRHAASACFNDLVNRVPADRAGLRAVAIAAKDLDRKLDRVLPGTTGALIA